MRDAHGGGGMGALVPEAVQVRAAALRAEKIAAAQAEAAKRRARSGDTLIDTTRPDVYRPVIMAEPTVAPPGERTETATNTPTIPNDARIQKLLGRVKNLEAQIAGSPEGGMVLPTAEKTSAVIGRLKQEAKEARRSLADTLKQMGKEDLAALLQSETSPYSIASLKLRASRALAGNTLSALEEIEALTAPARASLEQVAPAPVPLFDRVKDGTKNAASTWYNRAKTVGKVVIGAGVINTLGVPASLALAGVGVMSVAAETCYRTYQKYTYGKKIEGLLPGVEALAEGMHRLIDNPRQAVADLFFDAAIAVSEETLRLDRERTLRAVEKANDTNRPDVAARMTGVDGERATALSALAEDASDLLTSERFSRTLELGPSYRPDRVFIEEGAPAPRQPGERTLPVAERVIRGVMEEGGVGAAEGGTIWAEGDPTVSSQAPMEGNPTMPESMPETMRTMVANFRKIAREGATGLLDVLPAMAAEVDALDARFPVTDPMDESLKEYLVSIVDFSVTIAEKAHEIGVQILNANGDVSVATENIEMFHEMTGYKTDYRFFDPGVWAVSRFSSIDELRNLKDKNGQCAADDPDTIALLSKLVTTVHNARTHEFLA